MIKWRSPDASLLLTQTKFLRLGILGRHFFVHPQFSAKGGPGFSDESENLNDFWQFLGQFYLRSKLNFLKEHILAAFWAILGSILASTVHCLGWKYKIMSKSNNTLAFHLLSRPKLPRSPNFHHITTPSNTANHQSFPTRTPKNCSIWVEHHLDRCKSPWQKWRQNFAPERGKGPCRGVFLSHL